MVSCGSVVKQSWLLNLGLIPPFKKKYSKTLIDIKDADLVEYMKQESILRHTGNHYRNHSISVGNPYGHN